MSQYSRHPISLNYLQTAKFTPNTLYKDTFECTSLKVKKYGRARRENVLVSSQAVWFTRIHFHKIEKKGR